MYIQGISAVRVPAVYILDPWSPGSTQPPRHPVLCRHGNSCQISRWQQWLHGISAVRSLCLALVKGYVPPLSARVSELLETYGLTLPHRQCMPSFMSISCMSICTVNAMPFSETMTDLQSVFNLFVLVFLTFCQIYVSIPFLMHWLLKFSWIFISLNFTLLSLHNAILLPQ